MLLAGIAVVFVADRIQPAGVVLAAAFLGIVVLSYLYLPARQAHLITAICSVVTLGELLFDVEAAHTAAELIERGLVACSLWLTAYLMSLRRTLRAALEETDTRYRAVFDGAADGILTIDHNGVICSANPALCRILGYEPAELAGQPLDILIPAEEREQHRHLVSEYAAGRLDGSHVMGQVREIDALHRNGELVPVEISVSDTRLNGRPFFSATLRDISERKAAERRIRESQRTLSTLMSNLPGMAYRCLNDADWTVVFVSQGCTELTGYEPHELENNRVISYEQIVYPPDRKRMREEVNQVLRRGAIFSIVYRIVHKSGEIRWVHERGSAVVGHDGRVRYLEGFISDVTYMKRIEESLRESEQRFRAIADSTPILIWASGTDRRITFVNQRLVEYTGKSEQELQGNGWLSLVHDDDVERVRADYATAFDAWQPLQLEYRLRNAAGEYRWILVAGAPRFAPDGDFFGYIGSAIDIHERKNAELAIRASEERFRIVANLTPAVIWLADQKASQTFVNKTWTNLTGQPVEDALGNGWHDMVHPDDLAVIGPDIARAYSRRLPFQSEFRVRCAKGGWRTLINSGAPRFDAEGQFEGYVGSCLDISERRASEQVIWHIAKGVSASTGDEFFASLANHLAEALEADMVGISATADSEQQPSRTIAFVRDGIIVDDIEYTLRDTPCAFALRDGEYVCPQEAVVKFPDDDFLAENGIEAYVGMALRDAGGQNLGVMWVLYRHRIEDNERALSLLRIFAVRAAAELERRRADEALRLSEQRFREMFEESPMAKIEVDFSRARQILVDAIADTGLSLDEVMEREPNPLRSCMQSIQVGSMNPAAVRMFQANGPQGVRDNLLSLFTEQTLVDMRDFLICLWKGATTFESETGFKTMDGESRIGTFHCVLMTSASDDWSQVLIAMMDVTESRQAEAELARAKRLETAGRLAGQIAHDFNNLLGPLVAYPEILQAKFPDEGRAHEMLRDMQDAALQIAEINQELLTLSRRGHYNTEPLDLNKLAQSATRTVELPATVALNWEPSEGELIVHGGNAQLMRAVLNLINNAVEAMDGVGELTVRTEALYLDAPIGHYTTITRGEYARLQVADSGCGIPAEALERIFEPFYTTKRADRKRGSGLGLPVVHSVVEDHDGYIDVESTVGEGTTFSIYLPLYRGEAAANAKAQTLEEGQGESVLVVDDDPLQRRIAQVALERVGYRVTAVESGEEAVRYLTDHTADVVILDMVMGGIDGAETLSRIRAMYPEQNALILTGYSSSDRAEAALALGNCELLTKPIQVSTLTAALRRALTSSPLPDHLSQGRESA